jgi:hypothetical protein
VGNYFYPKERAVHFLGQTVIKMRHTLMRILMGLINTGFSLEVVEEATPSLDKTWPDSAMPQFFMI